MAWWSPRDFRNEFLAEPAEFAEDDSGVLADARARCLHLSGWCPPTLSSQFCGVIYSCALALLPFLRPLLSITSSNSRRQRPQFIGGHLDLIASFNGVL